jgi:hypothetical protein
MKTYETDPLVAQHLDCCRPCRKEGEEVLASRAIAAGRPEVLHPAAVLHLQRVAGNASVARFLMQGRENEPSPVKEVGGSGGGVPLGKDTRESMEFRLGHDLRDVRAHTYARTGESAKSVNAEASTVGSDIVFRSARYTPETHEGHHMPAHEATHVIQQGSGPLSATPVPGGTQMSDPSDSFGRQTERTATQVVSAEPAGSSLTWAQFPSLQRQGEGAPEEEVQGSFVQRQDEKTKVRAVQRHIKNKNYVEYGGTNSGGTGTTMRAELWPGYSPGPGSKPSVEPFWWPHPPYLAGDFFQKFMVQGHLLNEKIGGPGNIMDNLAPITKSANAMHEKKIENAVKSAVKSNKYVVDYHVDADYSYAPKAKELAPNESKAVQKHIKKTYAGLLPGQIIAEFTAWNEIPPGSGKWKDYGDRWKIGNEAKEIT